VRCVSLPLAGRVDERRRRSDGWGNRRWCSTFPSAPSSVRGDPTRPLRGHPPRKREGYSRTSSSPRLVSDLAVEGSGKTGSREVASLRSYATLRPPVRRFLSAPVPLRLRYTLPWLLGLRHWPLRLCARPAHTARSGGRGTLGRGLPGPATSSVTRRRRRSSPAFERLRSVPGRKDGVDYAGGFWGCGKGGENIPDRC
jgi:hypothetical protein